MKNSNLVYSTDQGRLCPSCERPVSDCQCKNESIVGNGKVLIALETKGRKGKGVTIVTGLPLTERCIKGIREKIKNTMWYRWSGKRGTYRNSRRQSSKSERAS